MPARAGKIKAASPSKTAPSGWATPAQVSAYLQKPLQTLANWRWKGEGPPFKKFGRSVRYDWADVYGWERSQPGGGAGVRRGAA